MSAFDRFGKDKKDEDPEVSEGGSIIHRYSAEEWAQTRIGAAEGSAEFGRVRDEVYERRFGIPKQVWHEVLPLIPHVDVMEYYRKANDGGNDVCVLVTSGMSDLAMAVPAETEAPRRIELIFYCSQPAPVYAETLRFLEHFAHDQKTWIGAFHTIPLGNARKKIMGSVNLDTVFLLPPLVLKDRDLSKDLVLNGDGVDFVWVVPISAAECKLKLSKGSGALLALLQKNKHPYIYDPARQSYV